MILKLEINNIAAGIYVVHCEGYAASPISHDSIAAALKPYGKGIPREFTRFVEVHYGGVSLGTTPVIRLAQEPDLMARELAALLSVVDRANATKDEMLKIEKGWRPLFIFLLAKYFDTTIIDALIFYFYRQLGCNRRDGF